MLLPKRLLFCKRNLCSQVVAVANYSRKSDNTNSGYYKVVSSNDVVDDVVDNKFGGSPNWELFAPRGYRFVLPGSLGPAWHEPGSMVPVDVFSKPSAKPKATGFNSLECTAQDCPILLRQGVLELFSNSGAIGSQNITIVTLAQKGDRVRWKCKDTESEYLAKTFMWAAQEICMRLKTAGYWADFINPFSGKPYLTPNNDAQLYDTDERFRCIGFAVNNKNNCKIIQGNKAKFMASLFTNAPASTTFLYELLKQN